MLQQHSATYAFSKIRVTSSELKRHFLVLATWETLWYKRKSTEVEDQPSVFTPDQTSQRTNKDLHILKSEFNST